MNQDKARQWGDENLTPATNRNFQKALREILYYSTEEGSKAYDDNWRILRELVINDPVKVEETKVLKDEQKQIEEQINALYERKQEIYAELSEVENKAYDRAYAHEDYKKSKAELEYHSKIEWAVKELRIGELVAKYEKKIKVAN